MGFFPTLCVYRLKQRGERGAGGGPTAERELLPLHASGRLTGGAMLARTHTRVSWRALIWLGGRDEGQRVGRRGRGRLGNKSPPPAPARQGVNLKGCSVSQRWDGWGGGQWSRWSARGAPRYPVIHDNQRGSAGEHGAAQLWSERARLERRAGTKQPVISSFSSLSAGDRPQTCPSFLQRG